jgi:hypothetical protein
MTITNPDTSEATASTVVATAGDRPGRARAGATEWLRRSVAALAVVTGILVVTGLFLTFRYRPGNRVDAPGVEARSWLVAVAQALHAVGGYAFVALVCVVVGTALVVANQRSHAPGVILTSGFGLFAVSIGFLLTGLQLPWRGFKWVASGFSRSFDGIVGFPREVVAVLVGTGEVSPARYETVAWIHMAGLPVFAVFAAWWMLGAVQASRRPRADEAAATEPRPAAAAATVSTPPPAEPTRPVPLAEQLFGTDDPGTVRLQVDAFLTRHLGTGIAALDFTRIGTGIILGVTLGDGRPAVVRLYPPGADAGYLRCVQDLQLHLVAHGFPAPRPLLGPTPFGVGLATVEGRLFEPPPGDPADPAVRRALAEGLAVFVRLAAPLAHHADLSGRGPLGPPDAGSAFPRAPGSPFDFAATAAGAEWIEDLGRRARAILDAAPPTAPVVGHFGWRIENVALTEGAIVGVFDWSQIGSAPESVVVGSAAHQFTIDGRSPRPHVPTAEEIRAFVAGYDAARGTPLTTPERVASRAAYVYCTAYAARCEHALAVTGQATSAGFRERLASTGAALLA